MIISHALILLLCQQFSGINGNNTIQSCMMQFSVLTSATCNFNLYYGVYQVGRGDRIESIYCRDLKIR